MVAAVYLGRRLAPKLGAWNATLVAGGAYLVAVARGDAGAADDRRDTRAAASTTRARSSSPGFPADDLYEFRLFSLGTQVVMWATIGLVFAALVSRLLDGKRAGARIAA